MLNEMIIAASNRWARFRNSVENPSEILIISPHCLQNNQCKLDLSETVEACEACGKCPCAGLKALANQYKVRVALVGGGTEALNLAKAPEVKAIIAIACCKELRAGICAVFPKPVLAVSNSQPHGPCKNTDVPLEDVELAVKTLLGLN